MEVGIESYFQSGTEMEAQDSLYMEEEKGRDKWEGGETSTWRAMWQICLEKVKMPTEGKKGVECHVARTLTVAQILGDGTNHEDSASVFCGFRFTHLRNLGPPRHCEGTKQEIPERMSC